MPDLRVWPKLVGTYYLIGYYFSYRHTFLLTYYDYYMLLTKWVEKARKYLIRKM